MFTTIRDLKRFAWTVVDSGLDPLPRQLAEPFNKSTQLGAFALVELLVIVPLALWFTPSYADAQTQRGGLTPASFLANPLWCNSGTRDGLLQ